MQKERVFDPEEGPYNLDAIGVLLFNMIKIQREILDLLKEDSKLDGTTVTNIFSIPNGAPVVKFDFVEAKHRNIPPNVSFDVPLVPVQQMLLKNLGPGTLYYSTNKSLNQLEAASNLLQGEEREIRLKKRAIRQLNLAASGGSAMVRLELLI
jgi:hypothetical protein